MSTRLTRQVNADDHVVGADDAPVTLVEYGDFECEFCGRAYPILNSIRRSLGARLRFVYRHFPLREAHPHAEHAAETAEAAASMGGTTAFWAMHDALFTHQEALEDDDLLRYAAEIGLDARDVDEALSAETFRPRVRADFRSGVRSGVNGTPTFFINGERYDGSWMNEREFTGVLVDAASSPSGRPRGIEAEIYPASESRADT
jgi:formate-nitrite transporter family protein